MSAWTRRDFIRSTGLAGGAAFMTGAAMLHASPSEGTHMPEALLQGVCDLHVHAAPDVTPRSVDELGLVREARQAEYRALMFKSNEWSCHDRAWLIRQIFPDFHCFGSLCMNHCYGDRVNPHAAAMAVKTTGGLCKCIWMPTQAAAWQHAHDKLPGKGIPVLSDTGRVLPEVIRVMEVCAEADIIFATGHSSPEESLVLAGMARDVGVRKFVVTHANSHIWRLSRAQVMRVAELGGYLEYSYITNLWGPGTSLPAFARMSDADFVTYARLIPERSFITTDLGQPGMPHPLEGMRRCVRTLLRAGMSRQDIDLLIRKNPATLMGLDNDDDRRSS